MNVLVLGSGGREYAMAYYISQSPLLSKLFVAPGSDAMANFATVVDLNVHNSIEVAQFCKKEDIKLAVIGPEEFLFSGLSDSLAAEDVLVFGPNKAAAELESSKIFTKDLCSMEKIPTAKYGYFDDPVVAKNFVDKMKLPVVVKANGPASGKGVVVCYTRDEAYETVDKMLIDRQFEDSSSAIIIEEYLEGDEISLLTLVDGTNVIVLGIAQDHKTAYEGDKGPNTGGMGAYSPVSIVTKEIEHVIIQKIIYPTVSAMSRKVQFRGVLFAGIMLTKNGPKLLEYNVRFGDPEIQTLLPRLKSDFLKLLYLTAKGKLGNESVELSDKATLCVVVASKGYPGEYKKGSVINGIEKISEIPGVKLFHAGTKLNAAGEYVSNGGRVLNIVAEGDNISEAKHKAYAALDLLDWSDGFFRYDIGWRELKKQEMM